MNERFEKLVFLRIEDILFDTILIEDGEFFWILDSESGGWLISYQSHGSITYNFSKFSSCLSIFDLKNTQFSKILKKWLEKKLKIQIRSVQRVNSNQDWVLEEVQKRRRAWELDKRFGFSYDFVKKILDGSETLKNENLKKVKNGFPMKTLFS